MKTLEIPQDGLEGLKQHWKSDAMSGFLVFLLAMPLSLGIAKASGYPAAMGVLTAMIGGMIVSIFQGGRLTIKGPAAGLITVCAGAVVEFAAYVKEITPGIADADATTQAVALTCGVIVVMAVIQVLFGLLKFGSLSDFFPHSAVHGMLAAIGILIFAKQFPILLGVDSSLTKGLSPIGLYTHIPTFIANANPQIALVGILSLVIIFGMPMLGGIFKKIPAPMVVLLIMIPVGAMLGFKDSYKGSLVAIGDFWGNIRFNAQFGAIGTGLFWKYVFMFLFVNSLESLLTVKAIDGLDPFKRKSDYNKDLKALALGNGLSGLLGGLPMISEVARSSANVNNGAKTRWANFFHGLFLFVAMLVLIPVIEMIPNAALAAMLIAVAYRLASPKEFFSVYKVGPEQLVIFLATIAVTVAEDLLLGVATGILIKFVFHLLNGASFGTLFKASYEVKDKGNNSLEVIMNGPAIFSNLLGYQKMWNGLPAGKNLTFNFSNASLVDHTFQEALHHFEEDYHHNGGQVEVAGLERHQPLSSHPMAARKQVKGGAAEVVATLSARQLELQRLAVGKGFTYEAQRTKNATKFDGFPIEKGATVRFEENVILGSLQGVRVEISDVTVSQIAFASKDDTHITAVYVEPATGKYPEFALEPEGLHTKLSELVDGKDIDFDQFPVFSKQYYLRGQDESAVRNFFSASLIQFLESKPDMHVEAHNGKLLFYQKRDLLDAPETEVVLQFVQEFLQATGK